MTHADGARVCGSGAAFRGGRRKRSWRCSKSFSAAAMRRPSHSARLEWLVAHGGADRAVFAAPEYARGTLSCVAGAGISQRQYKRFSISLDDSAHPLVAALTNGSSTSFHDQRDLRVPPFGDSPFTAVTVGPRREDDSPALGLLLITPACDPAPCSAMAGRCP